MKIKRLIFPLALLTLTFIACDNNVVSQVEYDAVAAHADSLEAQNDSLQFEMQDLKLYNDYLERVLDSFQQGLSQR